MRDGPRKARSRRVHKLLLTGAMCVLMITIALVAASCVQISAVNLHSNANAGSDHLITMEVTSEIDWPSPVRATIAIRIPAAWEVTSVSFTGGLNGTATPSAVIANYFQNEWEAEPVDASHNGPKAGYKWWAGYSNAAAWSIGQAADLEIHIDTHGRGGTYLLDFVFGNTTDANPENLTNKGSWSTGGIQTGNPPTAKGILLDRQIILHCFTDVQPGHPFYTAIQTLGSQGLVQGYGPQAGGYYEFRPSNSVFRAQYAKFICGAMNAAGAPSFLATEGMSAPVNFPDLGQDNPGDLYPHEYVWTAYNQNVIKGYNDGLFRPYIPISRAHVITMTVRAIQEVAAGHLIAVPPGYVGQWGGDMLPEHAANARIAEYNNLLTGIPLASGTADMPRQEVAQIMWNMMNMLVP